MTNTQQMFQRASLPANYGACKDRLDPMDGGVTGGTARLSLRRASLHIKKLVAELEKEEPTLLQRLAKRVPCLGIMMSICASIFLGSAGMLVKMTHSVHGIQVAVFRAMIQLIVYGTIIYFRRLAYLPKKRELLPVMGRALLGASSITCSYCALKMIPLGDATTIRFSLPIWTLIISYLVLNESCSLFKVAAVVVSILGVVLIAKPDDSLYVAHLILYSLKLEDEEELAGHLTEFKHHKALGETASAEMVDHLALEGADISAGDSAGSMSLAVSSRGLTYAADPYSLEKANYQLEGSLLALSSSICLSLSLVSLRLCKRTEAEITIFWLSVYSVLLGSVTLLTLSELRLPDNLLDCLFILLNGVCGCIGQWFITCALKIEQSGVISLARTFDIQVAFLYSAFLLQEHIRSTSVVGSVLVSLGVVAVVVPKWLTPQPQQQSSSSPASLDQGDRSSDSPQVRRTRTTTKTRNKDDNAHVNTNKATAPLATSAAAAAATAHLADQASGPSSGTGALPVAAAKRFSQPVSNYQQRQEEQIEGSSWRPRENP